MLCICKINVVVCDIFAYMRIFCYFCTKFGNMNDNKAKTFLKIEMLKEGISNEDLQRLLQAKGYNYTLSSINSKISRGTFSATFLIQCLEVMGHYNVNINDLLDK